MNLSYVRYTPHGLEVDYPISFSTKLILWEAEKHGVRWEKVPEAEIFELTLGQQKEYFHYQIPSTTTALGTFCCNKKNITRRLLSNQGISIAKGYKLKKSDSSDYQEEIYSHLKKPLVVKPLTGSWGAQVTVNINSIEAYKNALDQAFSHTALKAEAIVEEMFFGNEYRILTTKNKVIGIVHRKPAHVIGDGKLTVKQLVKQKNQHPLRGNKTQANTSHYKIKITKTALGNLIEQNLTPNSIPKKNQHVYLQKVSNVSQGGEAIDVTDIVHQSVKDLALKVIRAIPGLEFTGIDFMTTDITKPQTNESYIIIEINDSPGFDIHDFPYQGKNRHAAREFLYILFPTLRQ